MTIRETILDTVMTTLVGTTGAGLHIYRSRLAAVQADATIAVIVRPIAETPEPIVITFMDRTLDIEVLVRARGDIPDAVADDTVGSVHAKLMADRTLGGAVLDLEDGPTDWAWDEADTDLVEVRLTYRLRYRTQDNSLTT